MRPPRRRHLRYTPAAGTVLNAGSHTLSVTFTPADAANYNGATANGDARRRQGHAGDHLADAGGHHLRHGAERHAAERDRHVAGTFVYTPAAGTVLNAGSQTLSVTFTPTDAANYTRRDDE